MDNADDIGIRAQLLKSLESDWILEDENGARLSGYGSEVTNRIVTKGLSPLLDSNGDPIPERYVGSMHPPPPHLSTFLLLLFLHELRFLPSHRTVAFRS